MKKVYLSLFAAALLFTACEKDDPIDEHVEETKDELAPELTVSGLHESGLLVGEEQLQIEATDDGGIAKIEVFMDSQLLGTLSAAPYEVNINSTTYTDGEYELKMVAFDKAGNQQEWKQSVKVSNVLMVIDTRNLGEHDFYYLISDENGKVLESAAVEKGKEYTITSPDDYYGVASASLFYIEASNFSDYKDLGINSWMNIERGKRLSWTSDYEDAEKTIGTYDLEVSNMTDASIVAAGMDGSWHYVGTDGIETVGLYQSPLDVIFVKSPYYGSEQAPAYKLVKDVKANTKVSLDFLTVNEPFLKNFLKLPDSNDSYITVDGITPDGRFIEINNNGESDTVYYLPSSIFAEQRLRLSLYKAAGDLSHELYKKFTDAGEVSFNPLQVTIEGSKLDKALNFKISGDAHTFAYAYLSAEPSTNHYISWLISVPAGTEKVFLPELTEELKVLTAEFNNVHHVELKNIGVINFLSGTKEEMYIDMLELLRDNEEAMQQEFQAAWKSLTSTSGGRVKEENKRFGFTQGRK